MVCTTFGLEEVAGWGEQGAWRSDSVVGYSVEDNVLAGARGKIVDRLESLIGDAMQFESGMESYDRIFA